MQIRKIEIFGYRSVHELWFPLRPLNVLVGPNGCGKSNIYQALQLMSSAATGQLAQRIANEGGMNSISWAGRRHKDEEYRVKLAVSFEQFRYEIEFGLIPVSERPDDGQYGKGLSYFKRDPDIKSEIVQFVGTGKKVTLLQRKRGSITARNIDGEKLAFPATFSNSESVLFALREPHRFPELSIIREELCKWRFYHNFRTDPQSPIRQPRISTLTPILRDDGSDLVAALATIRAIGDGEFFDNAIENAFPGSAIYINDKDDDATLHLGMSVPGLGRSLGLRELSDGTLQYLCLLAALLTPRPAPFMVFNEPETSIHPNLFEPLAKLLVKASEESQIWITTHSRDLADYILEFSGYEPFELEKVEGETRLVGVGLDGSRVGRDDEDE